MALTTVSLQVLYLLSCCAAISTSCSAVQCKLLLPAPDVSTEFQSLASEKDVRIVYLHLKVGDNSYRPLDLKNVFFPERWVWANSISEPMLSMEYDHDIFSFSLFKNQARSINVHLIEEPSGCLANLNSSCQNTVVGKVLLENVTRKSSDKTSLRADVVCVAIIEKAENFWDYFIEGNIQYHCCETNKGRNSSSEPPIHCDLSVKKSEWFIALDNFFIAAFIIIFVYCPAFSFVLPEEIVMNIGDEIRKEANDGSEEGETTNYGSVFNRQQNENEMSVHQDEAPSAIVEGKIDRLVLPVDDASPITCSALLHNCANKLPGFQLSFNVKLIFLSYLVIPFFLYVFVLLNYTLKGDYLKEAFRKDKAYLGGIVFFLVDLLRGGSVIVYIFFLVPLVIIVSLKPKDLIEDAKILSPIGIESETYKRTVGTRISQDLSIMQDKVYQIFFSLSKSYLNWLKKFLDLTIKYFLQRATYTASRSRRTICVFCVLILSLIGFFFGVLLAGFFLVIFLVKTVVFAIYLSPNGSIFRFLWGRLTNELYCHKCTSSKICRFILTFLIHFDAIPALLIACSTVSICCHLVIKVLGYTLMGFILNTAIATPYAVFLLVVITNVYLCYANLQNRYKEVKEIISKEWEKNKELLLEDQRHLANESDATIPRELFWFVCGEDLSAEYTVLPIQTEMIYMFRNMICVLAFLFVSLSSVIIFGNLYQISTVVTSIVVFISGVIPKLFLQGFTKQKKIVGWEKITITRQTEAAVKTYIQYVNNGDRPRHNQREEFILSNFAFVTMPDRNEPEECEELLLTNMRPTTTRE